MTLEIEMSDGQFFLVYSVNGSNDARAHIMDANGGWVHARVDCGRELYLNTSQICRLMEKPTITGVPRP